MNEGLTGDEIREFCDEIREFCDEIREFFALELRRGMES